MRTPAPRAALSVVLIVVCGLPRAAQPCPHPCACYVPSEVHCTFRSLAAVPAGISRDVERINLGFNSIQAISETSFAGLSKLELLMIHSNNIPSLPDGALGDLSSLQVFKFSYNKLRVITRQTFQGLPSLMRLHLDHNQIEFIHPQGFQGLLSLRLLHLEGNLLHQLHPGTFSTFTFLDHFQLSTLRHLYLAENRLQRLPDGALQNLPLLENLYLHGNPWACDCEIRWFLDWTLRSKGILKCKKDKAYDGGQGCPTCSSPREFRKREIFTLPEVPCVRPSVESALRQNRSRAQEDEEEQEQEPEPEEERPWDGPLGPEDTSPASRWNISFNLTDEHGNAVLLPCDNRKPAGLHGLHLNQTEPAEIHIDATVALDLECPVTRENYEKVWKLIAYYSEVPLTLTREVPPGGDPGSASLYRQAAAEDAPYYTGIRAQVAARPAWVLQPTVHVRLDRRRSSAQKVLLSYSARYSQTVSAGDRAQSRSWVLIESGSPAHRAHTFLEGAPGQLSCRVRASESPSISWVLPDGSVLRAPEGRFSVPSGGWLKISTVERSDAGLYRCVAAVRDEVDQVAFRVSVQVPTVQSPEGSVVTIEKDAGEPVTLPCSTSGVPEAHLSWILPSKKIVDASTNASHAYVLADGSLSIPSVHASHAGYYRCVAVNLHGADHFTVGLAVRRTGARRSGKRGRRPGGPRAGSRPRGDFAEDEGGSGVGGEGSPPGRTRHPKDQGILTQAEREASAGATAPQKGRRKLRLWKPTEEKDPESNVAEGRRVFESRRRINVANKQINPERWADILARVRGKNLPKATGVPQDVVTATLPSESPEGTPLSPGGSPPSESPMREALDPEESSAQASLFGEEEQDSSTLSSPGTGQEHSHSSVLPEPRVTSPSLEEKRTGRDFAGTTEALAPNEMDLQGQLATTPGSEAYETPAARTSEGPSGGQMATEAGSPPADLEPIAQPRIKEEGPPLDVASLATSQTVNSFHPELETHPPPGAAEETSEDAPPASPAGTRVPSAPESLEDDSSAEPDVTAGSRVPEKTDSAGPGEKSWATERAPFGTKVMEKKFRGEGSPSGRPQREEQDSTSSGTLDAVSTTSPSVWPWTVTRGPLPDGGVATGATKTPSPATTPLLSTLPSRRRPSGRRRLRPHKARQRQKPSPPTPFASVSSPSPAPPSPLPQTQASKAATGSPVPSAGGDERPNTEKPSESASRRRGGKRPQPRRPSTPAPVGARLPVSKPSSSPETGTSAPEPLPPPWESTGPEVPTRPEGSVTATPGTAPTRRRVHGTTPVTSPPAAEGEAVGGDRSGARGDSGGKEARLRGELLAGTESSTPGPCVPTPGAPEDESPGSTSRHLASTAPPGTGLGEHFPDPALFGERQGPDAASHFAPARLLCTSVPRGEIGVPTTFSSANVEPSAAQEETTPGGWVPRESTVGRVPSETRPQNPLPTPAQVEEPAASFSPRAPASLDPTAVKPTPPAGAAPEQDLFSNSVGNPDTRAPLESAEGSQDEGRSKELETLPPKQNGLDASAKPEWAEGGLDGRTTNSLPRGPGSHLPRERVHTARPPATDATKPTPPRGTPRPPLGVTESSVRYFTTSQPPRHSTHRPEIPAYPSRVFPDGELPRTPPLPSTKPGIPTQPSISSRFPNQRTNQFNGYPKIFGNNDTPKPRVPVHELPQPRPPYHSGGRFPVFINRTSSFPQLGVTLKPQTSTPAAPVTRERKVTPGPYRRFPSQNFLHMDLGPPAPPGLQPPRTTPPPWPHFQKVPLVSTTRSSTFPVTAAGQSPGSPHHSAPKISVGGPPAPKFWTLGEKPQIITKLPQTASVTAETDAMFPCEAKGKPKPFITWTKVSTGALLTPNTRVQRFEVLQNGTLLIRRVQVQDRGQYLCTASNLHGVDKMGVLLSVEVQQPEILASRFQDVTVYLGDTIAMDCLAQGSPVPQISWIFPDRRVWQTASPVAGRVTLHRNRTLSIRDASFADRGVYKCVASNAAGADSLAIRLHVAALPPVIQQDEAENISLPPGLSVHIHCSARARPPASVRWVLRDGTQVRPSQFLHGNLFVFPNGTLYIRNLAPKDSGRYECVAANLVGSARRAVRLSVQRTAASARITSASPGRTDVAYGGTLRLHCGASGDPWPRILWRLPSKRMIDALFSFDSRVRAFGNGTLVVRSVTEKDAGHYLCVARNEVGDDHLTLQVHVVMKPAKIQHSGDEDHKVVRGGGDLKVDCVATGLPSPEISWGLPDGSRVNALPPSDGGGGGGGRAKRYVLFDNGTLYFNEVGPREEGDYTCFAQNQLGKDEMKVRVRVVAGGTAPRGQTPSAVRVPYGDRVAVACEATGAPGPAVTWLSPTNKVIPASSEKYRIHADGTLLIQKAQRADSGNYTCVVRGSAGEDRSTVWVHVHVEPPTINGSPDAVTTVREIAAAGGRKSIDCQARGVPTPRVLWALPEGVVLPAPYRGHRVTVHSNGSLDIRSLRRSDSMRLVCMARSEGGEARMVVQLTVLEAAQKPVFHDPVSEEITATAGHTISLNCSAAGSPPPALLWLLPNGTGLRGGQRLTRFYHKSDGRLHITGLGPGDAGAYRCVAHNAAGRGERLVSLSVGPQPARASRRHRDPVRVLDGESLRLPCSLPGGRFSWTLPSGLVLDGPQVRGRFSVLDNGTLAVREASVLDRGTYTCRVHPEPGPSSALSVPVIVVAYPPRITSEPAPVIYARPGATVKLSCLAVGVPKAEVSWELPDKSHLKVGAQARLYGNRFLHPPGALTIQHATQRDAGFYKCTAKNILGTDSKTTYIHIY